VPILSQENEVVNNQMFFVRYVLGFVL